MRLLPLLLASFIFAGPALANGSLAPLLACRELADATARLDCFDRESGKLSAPAVSVSSPAVPAVAAPTPPPAVSNPRETFGLPALVIDQKEVAAGKRPAELNQIEAHLVSVSTTGTGVATFVLDNNQVWREVTPGGDLLVKPGDKLTISLGLFHSYWLQAKNGRGCKVTRVS